MTDLAWTEEPISFNYPWDAATLLAQCQAGQSVEPLVASERLALTNAYRAAELPGTTARMYVRQIVAAKLQTALAALPPRYGFQVFDTFRSLLTQKALFETILFRLSRENPRWDPGRCWRETRKFCAHPYETSRFPVPPHNSGGAIDLTLTLDGAALDMGTAFDDTTELAATDFFEREFSRVWGFTTERWFKIRANRRLLFNVMTSLGFSNYRDEWWHYDLGDCLWALAARVDWFFPSMEDAARQLDRQAP